MVAEVPCDCFVILCDLSGCLFCERGNGCETPCGVQLAAMKPSRRSHCTVALKPTNLVIYALEWSSRSLSGPRDPTSKKDGSDRGLHERITAESEAQQLRTSCIECI